ncbi:LamG domain-containing protein [Niabella sp.]|uniref:LamG domain-containing protein n=1 Tax=Niabella sp. TaxID=1962976 RepID=UPI002606F7F9|nr:LamG domain-containing protein [Niabella sp.]
MKPPFDFFTKPFITAYQSRYKMIKYMLFLTSLTLSAQSSMAQSINDSLLLYLPFNGNAADASGHNNNGVVHNATLTADRFGNANSAYNFNGTNSYIEIASSASLSKIYTSNEVTIAAWINIRNWYNNWNVFAVFEQYDPSTDWGSVLLEANWASGGILFESGYNTNYIGCDYTWQFNQWHHLAVTYSKLTDITKFYVDGNLVGAKAYHEAFSLDNVNSYSIGRSLSGPDEYSDGIIDEVRIYNRALKESELMTLPVVTEGPLPVTFGSITAAITGNMLLVQFTSLSENNNDRYIIEASRDGKQFKEIGTLKSSGGSSNTPIQYSFHLDLHNLAFAGFSLLAILLLPLHNKRRHQLVAAALVSAAVLISCTRTSVEIQSNAPGNMYIRIAQEDKDGTKSYSKIIQAARN